MLSNKVDTSHMDLLSTLSVASANEKLIFNSIFFNSCKYKSWFSISTIEKLSIMLETTWVCQYQVEPFQL